MTTCAIVLSREGLTSLERCSLLRALCSARSMTQGHSPLPRGRPTPRHCAGVHGCVGWRGALHYLGCVPASSISGMVAPLQASRRTRHDNLLRFDEDGPWVIVYLSRFITLAARKDDPNIRRFGDFCWGSEGRRIYSSLSSQFLGCSPLEVLGFRPFKQSLGCSPIEVLGFRPFKQSLGCSPIEVLGIRPSVWQSLGCSL